MDRSKTYIAMCRRSAEIQRIWRRRHGDFFAGADDRIECWVDRFETKRDMRHGFGIRREAGVIHLSPCTWLPRLDQLMELAQVPGKRFQRRTQDFFDWNKRAYGAGETLPGKAFTSLEQLWLAFVMQEKYDKVWLGGAWGKERPAAS